MSMNLKAVLMTILAGACIFLVGCGLVTVTEFDAEETNKLRAQLDKKAKETNRLRVQLDKKNDQIEKLKNETQKRAKSIDEITYSLKEKEEALVEAKRHTKKISDTGDIKPISAYDEQLTPMAKPGECYARVFSPPTYKTVSENILKSEPFEKIEIIPAKYEWVEKRIITTEESKLLEVVPAKYEWIEEQVLVREAHTEWKKGHGLVEKIDDVTGDIICLVEIPAQYKTVKKKILVEPATVTEVVIPAEYTTIKVRTLVSPPQTSSILVPAEYQAVTRTIKASEGKMEWKRVLCETNLNSDVVFKIQQALSTAGHDPGQIDGAFGPRTHDAIKSYQEEQELATGGLTYETIRSLGIELY